MKKRSCVTIIRCLLFVVMMSLFMGGTATATAAAQVSQGSRAKEDYMDIAYKTESAAIAAIDEAVPIHFQTASFGLG